MPTKYLPYRRVHHLDDFIDQDYTGRKGACLELGDEQARVILGPRHSVASLELYPLGCVIEFANAIQLKS
jgi:hypothetical protein